VRYVKLFGELFRLPLYVAAYALLDALAGDGHWLDAFAIALPRRGRFYYIWMWQVIENARPTTQARGNESWQATPETAADWVKLGL
jgi:hypothetical protein